jgi:hypothetical protein
MRLYANHAPFLRKTDASEEFHNRIFYRLIFPTKSLDRGRSCSRQSPVSTNSMAAAKIRLMSRRAALPLMVLCLFIAGALRFPELTERPPGLHYDEAANGILAGDIGLRGERPVFIASYTGKEALFFYIAGGLMRLLGESTFALRLASAFVGIVTVAVTYWLGLELTGDRRIALLAAALLAISFWHVLFSRLGFRAISQPLLQALAVAALFRGLRRDSWGWILAGGLALGLTAYTYLAARIFPIPLALALLPFLFDRPNRRRHLWQLGTFLAAALVIILPLAIYFFTNQDALLVRVNQVLPQEASPAGLAIGYLKSLGMLFLAGDPYSRFNIPGRPLFDWFWGALLVIGWIYALLRWRRQPQVGQRAGYLLLAILPFFMLLPTALALDEIVPSNLRAIGMLPFVVFLPAVGLAVLIAAVLELLGRFSDRAGLIGERLFGAGRRPGATSRTALAVVIGLLALLIVGGAATGRTYFQSYSGRADLFYESDADLVSISHYLSGAGTADKTTYLAAKHYRHPTVAFLSEQYDHIKWLPESQAIVFPAEGAALYIFPRNSPLPEWAAHYLSAEPAVTGPVGPDGNPTFEAYERASAPQFDGNGAGPSNVTMVNFGNQVTLLGYDVEGAASGENLPVTLYWRVEGAPSANVTPFIHLVDAWQYRWSQMETFAYPSEQWSIGDTIVQRVDLPLRPGMPPGSYRLNIGFFDPASGEQLARLDDSGRYAGTSLGVEDVVVAASPPPERLPAPANVLQLPAGRDLTLLGYERAGEKIAAGAPLWLELWWQATAPLEQMTTRLELLRPDNTGRILLDSQPVHDTYPFPGWSPPQLVIDHLVPELPPDIAPGEYQLNLRLLDGADETIVTADLGPLTVQAVDRLFAPPKSKYPLAATFGGEIELLGYDLEATGPEQYVMTLVWQALTQPSDSYTVFVHILDSEGVCCLWQQDVEPRQGDSPTDRWLAGEVVVDTYSIDLPADLPAGLYPVEIGLYLPQTGHRLLMEMPGLQPNDALFVRPLAVE